MEGREFTSALAIRFGRDDTLAFVDGTWFDKLEGPFRSEFLATFFGCLNGRQIICHMFPSQMEGPVMPKAQRSDEEVRLERLGKTLLAMPHKPRDESKLGKTRDGRQKRVRGKARPK